MRFPLKTRKVLFTLLTMALFAMALEAAGYMAIRYYANWGFYRDLVAHGSERYARFHPLLGHVYEPHGVHNFTYGDIKTDAAGRSITPLFTAKPEIVIAMTGGSTIFGMGSSSEAHTLASQVEQLLNGAISQPCEVINLASLGYCSSQELGSVRRLLVTHKVDLICAVSGVNDANSDWGVVPPHVWRASMQIRALERGKWVMPNIVNSSTARSLRLRSYFVDAMVRGLGRLRSTALAKETKETSDLPDVEGFNLDVDGSLRSALTNYACMAAAAKTHGAEYLMVLQPTLVLKAGRSGAEETIRTAHLRRTDEQRASRVPVYYKGFRDAPKTFPFVDMSGCLDGGGTTYADECHYNDVGARRFAKQLAEQLVPIIERVLATRNP